MKNLNAANEDLLSVKKERDALEGNCLEVSTEILKFAKLGFTLTQPEREYGRNAPLNGA